MVKDDDSIELRPIEVGPRVDLLQVVTKGLSPDERIAYDILRLRPELVVAPLPIQLNEQGRPVTKATAEKTPATTGS